MADACPDGFGLALDSPDGAPLREALLVFEYQRAVLSYSARKHQCAVLGEGARVRLPMALLLAADFLLQGGNVRDARAHLESAGIGSGLGAREQLYVQALSATCEGSYGTALALWHTVVRAHPSDLFAVHRAHQLCSLLHETKLLLEVARAAKPAGPLGHYANGMLAFALARNGDVQEAEIVSRQGLVMEEQRWPCPWLFAGEEDVWLQHSFAHALDVQQRHGELIAFLESRSRRWCRQRLQPFVYSHLWWHLAFLERPAGFELPASPRLTACASRLSVLGGWAHSNGPFHFRSASMAKRFPVAVPSIEALRASRALSHESRATIQRASWDYM